MTKSFTGLLYLKTDLHTLLSILQYMYLFLQTQSSTLIHWETVILIQNAVPKRKRLICHRIENAHISSQVSPVFKIVAATLAARLDIQVLLNALNELMLLLLCQQFSRSLKIIKVMQRQVAPTILKAALYMTAQQAKLS